MPTYTIGPIPTPNPPSGVNYTPQPSGGTIYSQPTGAELWNTAWNTGYNQANSTSNPYSGQVVSGYDIGQAFTLGQQQYLKDRPAPTTTNNTVSTNNVVSSPTPSGSTSAPSGPSQAEIEAERIRQEQERLRGQISSGYDAYISQLNQMLNQGLPEQQGIQNEIINNQYTSGENSLLNQQNIGIGDLGTERTQATQNQSKNLKDISENLRNMFMSGNVFLGSRGAGDSSAANQYSYALTKVGNKARGDVMSQTAGIQAEIAKRETQLKQTVQTELQNLGRERDNKILEVSNWIREQQQAIRDRIGQVGLSKSSDLTNLNTKILDAALAKLQQANEDVRNKKNLLTEWAANNATNINQLKSNLAAVSSYNPSLPQAQQFSGTPTISGGNVTTPINWSSNTTKEEEPSIFSQLPKNTWLK